MRQWNCRMIDHNHAPIGENWTLVPEWSAARAAIKYCEASKYGWEVGDNATVRVAEDGFVGEPVDYNMWAEPDGTVAERDE